MSDIRRVNNLMRDIKMDLASSPASNEETEKTLKTIMGIMVEAYELFSAFSKLNLSDSEVEPACEF